MENNIEEPSSPPAVIVLPGRQPLEQTQSQEDGITRQEPEKFLPINLRWWVLCLMVFLVMLVGLSIGIGVELHRKAKLPAEEDYAAGPASPTSSPPPPTASQFSPFSSPPLLLFLPVGSSSTKSMNAARHKVNTGFHKNGGAGHLKPMPLGRAPVGL